MQNVSERIKQVRKSVSLTQIAFAVKIGLKGNSLSQIETGTNGATEQTIRAICREFDVNYEWLTDGIGQMHPTRSDADIELLVRTFEGQNENKKQLIRIIAEMPDELLKTMVDYLESKFK